VYVGARTFGIVSGQAGAALTCAGELARALSGSHEVEVTAWINVYGAPPDTISYAVRASSQTAITEALGALAAQGDTQLRRRRSDVIGELVSVAGAGDDAVAFANIVTAQCEPGRISDAIAWAVDTGNDITRVTSLRTAVVRSLYGPWALLWRITAAENLSEIDDAEKQLATDLAYLEHLDECVGWFVPDSVRQHLIRRVL
jgi:hypothetical protein